MTIGIYKLVFNGTPKCYIGQSLAIEERYNVHIRTFKDKTAARKLLAAYQEYGTPLLEIVEKVDTIELLNNTETKYIEEYNSVEEGFNTQKVAGEMPRLYGEAHPQSKYTNEQVEHAFLLLVKTNLTHQQISEESLISKNIVNHIAAGSCHAWLRDKYPEQYSTFFIGKPTYGTSIERGKVYPHIKSPEGVVFTSIPNIRAFAREYSIPYSSLNSLLNFKTNSTKGWTRA